MLGVFICNHTEGGTKFLSTSSSTDSMNIILDLSWEIVIDDKVDIINIFISPFLSSVLVKSMNDNVVP